MAHPFTGVFDGNNHTISNLTYDSNDEDSVGLFGYVYGENAKIKNLGLIEPNVDAGIGEYVGSLVGWLYDGKITDCYVDGGGVKGYCYVGGMVGIVGYLWGDSDIGTMTNCYSTCTVSGYVSIGGLVGINRGTIMNCNSSSGISGTHGIGGLVGCSWGGGSTISSCRSTGNVEGDNYVGGLVGGNGGTIINSYASGGVTANEEVGGLVGYNGYMGIIPPPPLSMIRIKGQVSGLSLSESTATYQTNNGVSIMSGYASLGERDSHSAIITNCYSTGNVSGVDYVGGLLGKNYGSISASFWDIESSGLNNMCGVEDPVGSGCDNGNGKITAEMQTKSTFTDAGWDFNTPVWTIDEGVDYPRLWWEFVPVLHAEPDLTLGTSNTISWEPMVGAHNEYYAKCAEDSNFTSIVYSTGWITETSCEFTGLQLGQRYWYSVKARNAAGIESLWSNVESSLQCSLSDAVEIILDPNNLKSENLKKPYINKINIAQEMIDEGLYEDALNKLQNDILQKTDGCAETGRPDKNDWIITCEQQAVIYPLIIETIEHLKGLMR